MPLYNPLRVENLISNYRMRAHRASGLAISDSTVTAIVWDIEDIDPNNNYDPTTGIYTAPVAGDYDIRAHGIFVTATDAAATQYMLQVVKNSTEIYRGLSTDQVAVTVIALEVRVACVERLAAGDTITIKAFQNSGGTRNFSSATATQNVLSIGLRNR